MGARFGLAKFFLGLTEQVDGGKSDSKAVIGT